MLKSQKNAVYLLKGVPMAFQIINADITKLNVEAIVNPTDQYYSGDGGVDMQLYDICGQALRDATDKLPKLHLGEAKATESFGLPCKYIIHTSGRIGLAEPLLKLQC